MKDLWFCIFHIIPCLLIPVVLSAQTGWEPDVRLTYSDTTETHHYFDPQVVCSGDTIHLVWWKLYSDSAASYEETFYKQSTDGGDNWSGTVTMSMVNNIWSTFPDIAVKGDTVITVWAEYQYGLTLARRSENAGVTWSGIDTISSCLMPSLAIVEDTVYLCGIKFIGGESSLVFSRSYDAGLTWDSLTVIYGEALPEPEISATESKIHIVTQAPSINTGTTEIIHVVSTDGGDTWDGPQVISHDDTISSQLPELASWASGVATIWYDYKYSPYSWTGDIFFRRNIDSLGSMWEQIESLTTSHRVISSDIYRENSNLHIAWEDDRHGFDTNFEIYYRESPDYGNTWFIETRLTNADADSREPVLTSNIDYLYCIWVDARDTPSTTDTELYFKRKDLSSATGSIRSNLIVAPTISPNPFRHQTRITWNNNSVPSQVVIYDILGRKVYQKTESNMGQHCIIWKGEDNEGNRLEPGIYFLLIETPTKIYLSKLIFM